MYQNVVKTAAAHNFLPDVTGEPCGRVVPICYLPVQVDEVNALRQSVEQTLIKGDVLNGRSQLNSMPDLEEPAFHIDALLIVPKLICDFLKPN